MRDLQPWTLEWIDPIHSLPAALMVAVALYRVSAVREGGASRSLWLALLALVGGSVVNIAPLHRWLLAVGGPAGQAVAVEVFTVLAAAFVLALIAQTTGVGCTRRLGVVTVAALLAMSVPLLVLRPPSLTDGPGGLPASASTADVAAWLIVWGVHWVVVLGLLTWAQVAAVLLCLRQGRAAAPGPLRSRLRLIGLGCISGLGFAAARALVIVASLAGGGPAWDDVGQQLQNLFLAGALIAIGIGSGYPQLVAGLATAHAEVSSARSLLRLHRLWRLMVASAPGITLTPSPLTSVLAGPLSLRERLYRRVMEIRDGLLALSPYASAHLRRDVAASAVALGRPAVEAEAVAEAVWITAAVRAKQSGHQPEHDGSSELDGPSVRRGGADLRAEVAWLELVADAHAKWPLTRRLEAEHLAPADEPAGERAA